jgi:hypothetical protein
LIIPELEAATGNLGNILFSLWTRGHSLSTFSGFLVFSVALVHNQFRLESTEKPSEFRLNKSNTFDIRFFDPDKGSEIEDVKSDISIYEDEYLQNEELRRLF